MAVRELKTFDPSQVGTISLQYKNESNDIDNITCIGMIQAETTVRTKSKTCSGATKDEVTYPQFVTVTATGYLGLETVRTLMGLNNEGLKPGVYGYNLTSKSPALTIVADLIDDMENVTKVVVFPNARSTKGLSFTVDNDSDDVAKVDMEFKATLDENGYFYYEVDGDELATALEWKTTGFKLTDIAGI